jgi:hypothetical protein
MMVAHALFGRDDPRLVAHVDVVADPTGGWTVVAHPG